MRFGRERLFALLLATGATALGLGIRAASGETAAKLAGDALWAVDVYALVRFVAPALALRRVVLITVGISFAIELLQLTPLPAHLSSQHPLLRLIFGSAFHPADLIAYAVGALAAGGLERLALGRRV